MRSRLGRFGAAVLIGATLAACNAESAAAPLSVQRTVGVLQLVPVTVRAGHGADSGGDLSDAPISWDSPPPRGGIYSPEVIDAPDTLRAGEATEVVVNTVGENGCWRADGIDATVTGNIVELTPYDVHTGAQACTEVMLYLAHPTTVTFDTPGEGVIRVTGRRARQQNRSSDESVSAEHRVVVVP